MLQDVLTAGGDTTTSTLSTAALLLQRHPAVAARVAAEAAEAFAAHENGGAAASMASLLGDPSALAYTRAAVLESTRLYPVSRGPRHERVAMPDGQHARLTRRYHRARVSLPVCAPGRRRRCFCESR